MLSEYGVASVTEMDLDPDSIFFLLLWVESVCVFVGVGALSYVDLQS